MIARLLHQSGRKKTSVVVEYQLMGDGTIQVLQGEKSMAHLGIVRSGIVVRGRTYTLEDGLDFMVNLPAAFQRSYVAAALYTDDGDVLCLRIVEGKVVVSERS